MLRTRLKATLPWLVAACVLYFLFSRVPISEALSVAQQADLWRFIPLVAFAVIFWFLIESAAYRYFFTRFNAPVSFAEARSLRGMSYLLTPIHWNVGKAAVILRLKQTKEVPLLESTSSVMLYQSIDGMVAMGLVVAGTSLLGSNATDSGVSDLATLRGGALAVLVMILVSIALIRSDWPALSLLKRLRSLALFHAHRQVTFRDILVLMGMKTVYFGGFVLVYFFGTRAFGLDLPLALVMATTPLIQAVGAIPITPAGLGTQQAAMLYFFGETFGAGGDGAAIVAFGFSFPIVMTLMRCFLGVLYLGELAASRDSKSLEE